MKALNDRLKDSSEEITIAKVGTLGSSEGIATA